MTGKACRALLFESVSAVLVAEKILKGRQIAYKLIPVPKHLSSDCGVCLCIDPADQQHVEEVLAERVKVSAIHDLS